MAETPAGHSEGLKRGASGSVHFDYDSMLEENRRLQEGWAVLGQDDILPSRQLPKPIITERSESNASDSALSLRRAADTTVATPEVGTTIEEARARTVSELAVLSRRLGRISLSSRAYSAVSSAAHEAKDWTSDGVLRGWVKLTTKLEDLSSGQKVAVAAGTAVVATLLTVAGVEVLAGSGHAVVHAASSHPHVGRLHQHSMPHPTTTETGGHKTTSGDHHVGGKHIRKARHFVKDKLSTVFQDPWEAAKGNDKLISKAIDVYNQKTDGSYALRPINGQIEIVNKFGEIVSRKQVWAINKIIVSLAND